MTLASNRSPIALSSDVSNDERSLLGVQRKRVPHPKAAVRASEMRIDGSPERRAGLSGRSDVVAVAGSQMDERYVVGARRMGAQPEEKKKPRRGPRLRSDLRANSSYGYRP